LRVCGETTAAFRAGDGICGTLNCVCASCGEMMRGEMMRGEYDDVCRRRMVRAGVRLTLV
jgi:hypothetical protein